MTKEEKNQYQKEWNARNPERIKEIRRDSKVRFKMRNPERAKEQARKSYLKNRDAKVLDGARSRAKRDGVPFDITREDIIFPEYCPILGIKLEHGKGVQSDCSPTLDRFIPEAGYVRGNINVISARANRMKSDASIEEISKLLDWMIKTQTIYKVAGESN
jgi:hypothetical protein